MKTIIYTIIVLLVLGMYDVYAQTGSIKGNIKDKNNKYVEYATVALLKSQDSTLVKGSITNQSGDFSIEKIAFGNYILAVSQVGYEKYFTPKFQLTAEVPTLNFKEIIVNEMSQSLAEVQVKASKPFVEQQIDRTVINVENSIVAAGNSALEVLEKSPGITVDQDGNISLKGKLAVLVYIDDKPTYMGPNDLANLLRNMQANQLEKIEIMTTPPAKYDAAGNAGIINLKLKRDSNIGLNGSVNGGYGYGLDTKLPKYNGGLNMNYRNKKWNIYGNANASDRQSARVQTINRTFSQNDKLVSGFDQVARNDQENNSLNLKMGVDYFANKNTTIGVLFNAGQGKWAQPNGINTAKILSAIGNLDSTSITKGFEQNTWNNISGNTNLKHKFDTTGREISIDLDFARYDNEMDQRFRTNKYLGQSLNEAVVVRNENGLMASLIDIKSAKLDYIWPLNKKSKLEMGAKSSFVNSQNDMTYWFLDKNEANATVDPYRTRDFQYKENINAAYVNYANDWKVISVQLGLRAENTVGQGTLNNKNLLSRNYTNLFPTAYFKKQLNKKNNLGLSIARRIDRPSYEDLNPFLFFLDPYTFQRGNEKLRPEFTNSVELTHTFLDALTTTLNFSETTDKMLEIIEQDNVLKTTNVTRYNIGKMRNMGIAINAPLPIKKWWMANIYINGYQNRFEAEIPRNTLDAYGQVVSTVYEALDVKAATVQVNMQNQIKLPKNLSMEISGWYQSAGVEGQMQMKPMGAINWGIKKTMMKGKGNLSLNVRDVFRQQYFRGGVNFNDINVVISNRWETRVARLNFSYRFGNTKVQAARQRETGLEAEKSRVKGGNN